MADQMRQNAGKLQLSYWLSTQASKWMFAEDSFEDLEQDCNGAEYLLDALGEFLRGEIDHIDLIEHALSVFYDGDGGLGKAYVRACMAGARKYDRGNFMLGAPISQYADCLARHLDAIVYGDEFYVESLPVTIGSEQREDVTLNHWDNVAWNVVMIFEVMQAAPNRDDRLFHCGNYGATENGSVPALVELFRSTTPLDHSPEYYDTTRNR